jgi:hypothetical protein
MLPSDAEIISVDDHVIEHPRVWLDRLPAKYGGSARRGALRAVGVDDFHFPHEADM